ncbi:MAG: glycoside hydrolase family 113 [Flavobacteriaceae bacterium]
MSKILISIYLCVLLSFCVSCSMSTKFDQSINGVSFVSSGEQVTQKDLIPVLNLNANYAAVMPFGFIERLNHPNLRFNDSHQWFGERVEGVKQYVNQLHNNEIQVMLKPQIWVSDGEFTGNIKMNSEENWQTFETIYADFILTYAKVAQNNGVAIYCIGTELEVFIKNRPEFWMNLIHDVRQVYKGKLTYAANWDEYRKTPFWANLDYIGIDGYFPLSDEKTPTISVLKKGWAKHKSAMKKHADSLSKKIMFTEYGYRSVDYAAAKPWDVDYSKTTVNLQGQVVATQVLFDELWQEKWFAGGFIWKWFIDHEASGGPNNSRFTPQNKPTENVIRQVYKRH